MRWSLYDPFDPDDRLNKPPDEYEPLPPSAVSFWKAQENLPEPGRFRRWFRRKLRAIRRWLL